MNVGVFLTDLPPEVGGGYTIQEDILLALCEIVNESRHTFVVLSNPALVKRLASFTQSARLKIVACPPRHVFDRFVDKAIRESETFRLAWTHSTWLDRVTRQWQIDFMWFFDSVLPLRVDQPYLTIVWDLQHRLQPWFPEVSEKGGWDRRESFHAWFLRRASFLIAGTKVGRDEIERFYQVPLERIKLLPHPIPRFALQGLAQDAASVLTKYNLSRPYIFYPAQFWAHKNHTNLLYAIRHLRDVYHLIFHVVLVGSDRGNLAHVRQLVNELALTEQVHLLGFVSREELVALYQNAFALTYLTFFGPENLPPLEAFGLGCPVIASNVPGSEEQFGDTALRVAPTDPAQIALAIKSLLDDPARRHALIERGRARAMRWTGHDFVRGVFALLDEFESVRRCWG